MHHIILALGLAASCVPVVASADEVYKWTDKNGTVHYGEFAPSNSRSKTIETPSTPRPADEAELSGDDAPLDKQKKALEGMNEDRIAKKEAKEKADKEKQEATRRCNIAKGRLALYENGGRIQVPGADGKLHVLSDAELKTALIEARKDVERMCKR